MCFLKLRGILFFVSRETNKHETDAVSDIDFNPGILKVRVLSRERRQKMSKIQKINKQTENRFLNLYDLEAKDRMGGDIHYYVSSRAKTQNDLKINTRNEKPDGVIIYSLYGEKKDRVVLVRQYRYPLDDYVYELPSGLVDQGEDYRQAGIREMKEETGLDFSPLTPDTLYERPFFTSVGMTDECCATVYGYASGQISREGLEDTEDLEVVLADREEVRRILKEERVAIMCAYADAFSERRRTFRLFTVVSKKLVCYNQMLRSDRFCQVNISRADQNCVPSFACVRLETENFKHNRRKRWKQKLK